MPPEVVDFAQRVVHAGAQISDGYWRDDAIEGLHIRVRTMHHLVQTRIKKPAEAGFSWSDNWQHNIINGYILTLRAALTHSQG